MVSRHDEGDIEIPVVAVMPSPHRHQVVALILEGEVKIYRKVTKHSLVIVLLSLSDPKFKFLGKYVELKFVKFV